VLKRTKNSLFYVAKKFVLTVLYH